jgi:hypothetical protein
MDNLVSFWFFALVNHDAGNTLLSEGVDFP